MSEYRHPLRDMALHVFERTDGLQWLAHFATVKKAPLIFTDPTQEGVTAKAEAWRAETVEKNEATYAARKRLAGQNKKRRKKEATA